jgi:2-polyprenyl-3-methyl-5-hydroxy-6-metoxy-1,4-benzoquinol methylase
VTSDLISEAYRAEQVRLHAQPQGYGGRGRKWAETVVWLRNRLKAFTVLDYGCGQGSLAKMLAGRGIACAEYDPAIAEKSALPMPADLVVCTDVLEHVEAARIESVLRHLRELTRVALLAVVNLEGTSKRLSDGSDAHILQRPEWWWTSMTSEQWHVSEMAGMPMPLAPEKQRKYWIRVLTPC